eukprot:4203874-Pyramimonas_sp.AAC.2
MTKPRLLSSFMITRGGHCESANAIVGRAREHAFKSRQPGMSWFLATSHAYNSSMRFAHGAVATRSVRSPSPSGYMIAPAPRSGPQNAYV